MASNRFNTYEDLDNFRRTRYHINRQIDQLTKEATSLPDVSNIETLEFVGKNELKADPFRVLEKGLEHLAILSEFEATCYACRLRDICVTLKCELNRHTFANVETVKDVIHKIYWKQKPSKIEAVSAVLCYLKLVGCDYSLEPYEIFLSEVKARKPHKPKIVITENL